MNRPGHREVSHSADREEAAAKSAAYPIFGPGKTWLPYGYRAELGAAFICADLALTPEPRPDHAAYVASWLKVLRGDKRAIFTAAAKAQAAADWMHVRQPAAAERAGEGAQARAA